MSDFVSHPNRDDLTAAIAEGMAVVIKEALAARGEAYIALSGGGTPVPIYEKLATFDDVAWSKVFVMLADERITPPGHKDSNETLVRNTLLQGPGAAATYIPLAEDTDRLPRQDLILLGMGGDGHFASLFPGAKELPAALENGAKPVMRVVPDPLPANAPFERLTLSLPAILAADTLVLAMTGAEKKSVLERAYGDGPVEELPIRALLRADHDNFSIHWAA